MGNKMDKTQLLYDIVGHSNNILNTFVHWDYFVKHAPIEI